MYNLIIVDDEPVIRRGIKSLAFLPRLGIGDIYESQNAKEALVKIEKLSIDIIMLDINMPDMDGLTLAGIIKERWQYKIVIMVTGYDYFEYTQTAIRIGVDDYLLKPVSRSDIEMVLKRMIDKASRQNTKDRIDKINGNTKAANIDTETGTENHKDDTLLFPEVAEYIKKHIYDSKLSLNKMASQLGFNGNYLSSVIKNMYGIPFQDYIGIKRMEQAKLLLLSTAMKNYEIAQAVGYEDVNYFITKFKKTYNITPRQYRHGVMDNEI